MIYVPLETFTFVEGNIAFQLIDAGAVELNTSSSWGGNSLMVSNSQFTASATKLSE